MSQEDASKTSFRTSIGNVFYTDTIWVVECWSHKTASHDMFHKMLEFYIDDLVVKAKEEEADFKNLQRVFEMQAVPTPIAQLESQLANSLAAWSIGMEWILNPRNSFLKKDVKFTWQEEHQKAFEAVKTDLTSPLTMTPPQQGKPLLLYITSIEALLAQEVGVERQVYYISRVIQGAEVRYAPIETHCLALVFAAKKLRHYLLSYPHHLITKCNPFR
ncbi:hypothetical protein Acr_17g0000800 [Actinidia rufa]|uniref:Reverse transcriptase/retrotransposon-derived protein RNase H-like domain-containing protein n=1 Tax=Actinidia rufa TaxID=165716 RepID=A0A7J0G162_9ERIC|nr:hypothetical protein Acr_17g0000800 [Actinidia rufa]